jgi:hypothetical protein
MPEEFLTEQQIRKVVKDTVHETLAEIGMDAENLHELQSDFIFLRNHREGAEEITKYVKKSTVGLMFLAVPGILWLVWQGVKTLFIHP